MRKVDKKNGLSRALETSTSDVLQKIKIEAIKRMNLSSYRHTKRVQHDESNNFMIQLTQEQIYPINHFSVT